MDWIEAVRGKVVGLDTAPVIYYIEKDAQYIDLLRPFFQLVDSGECFLITSTITLLEILVVPIRKNNMGLIQEYRDLFFNVEGFTTYNVDPDIAEIASRLRAKYTIRPVDSIQVATAIYKKAQFFLTNDIHLPTIPELPMLFLDDLKASSGSIRLKTDS